MDIRRFRPADAAAVLDVHRQAFGGREEEARIAARLHDEGSDVVSLVAVVGGDIVGHVVCSPVTLAGDGDGDSADAPVAAPALAGVGPIGVVPGHQGRGIGARLMREALAACRSAGYDAVVVLGDPAYYTRFGFERASDHGLANEYGADDAFMVAALRGPLPPVRGTVRYSGAFDDVQA